MEPLCQGVEVLLAPVAAAELLEAHVAGALSRPGHLQLPARQLQQHRRLRPSLLHMLLPAALSPAPTT